MSVRWTIGICTWNRSELLKQTLESITKLNGRDPDTVEVLIVNNGSTDDTALMLRDFANQPGVRVVLETKLGHTYARNRLVREAHGDVILWTDGDVRLHPQWLNRYTEVIDVGDDFDFWGGPIIPVFLAGKPRWISQNYDLLAGCFAAKDLGNEPIELDSRHLPYGANFAVRTRLARNYLFDEQLGRRGTGCVGEDERDFLFRLLDKGHRGQWIPAASVEHLIPADRVRLAYIGRYFAGQAEIQFRRGEAPDWTANQFRDAARDHRIWFQLTRFYAPSRVWLDHWIKVAQFQQWAELKETGLPR